MISTTTRSRPFDDPVHDAARRMRSLQRSAMVPWRSSDLVCAREARTISWAARFAMREKTRRMTARWCRHDVEHALRALGADQQSGWRACRLARTGTSWTATRLRGDGDHLADRSRPTRGWRGAAIPGPRVGKHDAANNLPAGAASQARVRRVSNSCGTLAKSSGGNRDDRDDHDVRIRSAANMFEPTVGSVLKMGRVSAERGARGRA